VVVKYLFEKGFQKIGFVGELGYSLSIKERFWGFKEAINNLAVFKSNSGLEEYISRYSITEDIEEAVLANDNKKIVEVVQRKKYLPEVYVCSNDKAAIALMNALQTLGSKVPDDISLVGFDNIDMCEKVRPKLTTVNVNKEIMGKRAVQRIIYKIGHLNSLPENTVIGVELIERESVRKPH
jgi:LacI family transcriptional regulator